MPGADFQQAFYTLFGPAWELMLALAVAWGVVFGVMRIVSAGSSARWWLFGRRRGLMSSVDRSE